MLLSFEYLLPLSLSFMFILPCMISRVCSVLSGAIKSTRELVERRLSSCAILNARYKRPISER